MCEELRINSVKRLNITEEELEIARFEEKFMTNLKLKLGEKYRIFSEFTPIWSTHDTYMEIIERIDDTTYYVSIFYIAKDSHPCGKLRHINTNGDTVCSYCDKTIISAEI